MSTPDRFASILRVAAVVLMPLSASADEQAFGSAATDEDVERVWLTVMPDGANLPEGSGTARDGKPLYDLHCASCHGIEGEGTLANQIAGGHGTLASDAPVKTVGSFWPTATTAFDYIRRSMPYQAPMSLTNDDYYAITAYVLHLSDIVAVDAVIDAESLPAVAMPNRDGFVNAYPEIPPAYDYRED